MKILKAVLSAAIAAVAAYFQQLIIPVIVLIAVMMIDYVSGVSAAYVNSELSSRTGILGILKKVGYLMIVAVGMVIDYLLSLAGGAAGLDLSGKFFVALVVVIWLIINECLSILENSAKMGLPVPGFVTPILERLKSQTEDKVNPGE